MKKIILIIAISIAVVGANIMLNPKSFNMTEVTGLFSNKNELYDKADSFVESLQTTYQSYGMLGGEKYATTTSDGLYRLMPVGRLINVKIQEAVSGDEYESLKEDLKDHYKNDPRVNDVYICGGGTIMVDCRN